VTLLAPGCELTELTAVGEGKHLAFRVRRDSRDSGRAIAFGFGKQLDSYRRAGRYDVAFRLQENHWNGTVAPQLVVRRIFDSDDRFDEVRDWLVSLWKRGEQAWTADVRAIFEELGVGADGAPRRHLLESARFRELLADPPLARAA
jgi:hypothetical protein